MIVGFTGTKEGLTTAQLNRLRTEVRRIDIGVAHHGDCRGADANFHDCVRQFHRGATIVIHPPTDSKHRAYKKGDVTQPEDDYLTRNANIAFAAEYMIACPKEHEEVMRSGTWATVRKARQYGKPILFIYPDGSVLEAKNHG